MRIALIAIVVMAFLGLGALDLVAGNTRLGLASVLLAAVNYLFLIGG